MDTFFTKWNALSPVCLLEIAKSKPRKYWLAKMAKLSTAVYRGFDGYLVGIKRGKKKSKQKVTA